MTAASCPTALGALCSQLTFQLACCREHSAVMATELLHPLDVACGQGRRHGVDWDGHVHPTFARDHSWNWCRSGEFSFLGWEEGGSQRTRTAAAWL